MHGCDILNIERIFKKINVTSTTMGDYIMLKLLFGRKEKPKPSFDDLDVVLDINIPLKNLVIFQSIQSLPSIIAEKLNKLNTIVQASDGLNPIYDASGNVDVLAVLQFLVYETCRRQELVGYEVMEMILDKETFPEYHKQCVALKSDYESHYRESLRDVSLIKYILDGTDKPSKRYDLESKVAVDDLLLKEICYLENILRYGRKTFVDKYSSSYEGNYTPKWNLATLDGTIRKLCGSMKLFKYFDDDVSFQIKGSKKTVTRSVTEVDLFVLFHFLVQKSKSEDFNHIIGYTLLEDLLNHSHLLEKIL